MIHRLIYKNIVLFFMFISMTFSLSAQYLSSPCPKFRINNTNTGLSVYGVTPAGSVQTAIVRTNWKALTGGATRGIMCNWK